MRASASLISMMSHVRVVPGPPNSWWIIVKMIRYKVVKKNIQGETWFKIKYRQPSNLWIWRTLGWWDYGASGMDGVSWHAWIFDCEEAAQEYIDRLTGDYKPGHDSWK